MHRTPSLTRLLFILALGLSGIHSWASGLAAVAPRSPEELKKESTHILTGTVLEVKSTTRKSKIETGVGLHRDRIYRIKLKVEKVTKGEGVSVDATIEVVAWRPSLRVPPLPGPQGHGSIPAKGDRITVHGKQSGQAIEPILPNGIKKLGERD